MITNFIKFIFIFILGFCLGFVINIFASSPPEPNTFNNVNSVIHQEQIYINGVRYTVVTSNASSMVIMR